MEIEFLKMQGCGDDTLVLDCFKQERPKDEHLPRMARKMLDRRLGIGADSLLLLSQGLRSRLSARSFSQGGEEILLSHNALRCAARYASDSGIVSERKFPVETRSGETVVEIIDSINVRLDMGAPLSRERASEIFEKPLESYTRTIAVNGRPFTYTPVSLMASFGVTFVPAFDFSLPARGREIAGHPEFPQQTGIGFVQVFSREELRLRVWEAGEITDSEGDASGRGSAGAPRRKSAESIASCPAAAAAVVASVVNGFTDREVFVHLAGGDVFVQWDEKNNRLYLTGPTTYVFRGTFYFEEGDG
jgi:diaminopimelate epimerase